jgi:transporter family protein
LFASLTAIFAKVGIKGVDTYLATAIRTLVIVILAWAIAFFGGGTLTIQTLSKTESFFPDIVWYCNSALMHNLL